jgi:hypothetical protein
MCVYTHTHHRSVHPPHKLRAFVGCAVVMLEKFGDIRRQYRVTGAEKDG